MFNLFTYTLYYTPVSQDTIKTQTYQSMFSNEKRNKNTKGSIKYNIDGVMFPSDQTNDDTNVPVGSN